MSQQPHSLRYAAPAPRPRPSSRPPLRVVAPPRRRAGRVPFIIFCSVLMTLGLGALLALNLSLVSGSYTLHDLGARVEAVRAEEAELTEKVALQSTSTRLAERATELGMVSGGTPAYLRLSDGAVLGNPTPAPTPASLQPTEQASGQATGQATGRASEPSGPSGPSETPSAEPSAAATSAGSTVDDAAPGAAPGREAATAGDAAAGTGQG